MRPLCLYYFMYWRLLFFRSPNGEIGIRQLFSPSVKKPWFSLVTDKRLQGIAFVVRVFAWVTGSVYDAVFGDGDHRHIGRESFNGGSRHI